MKPLHSKHQCHTIILGLGLILFASTGFASEPGDAAWWKNRPLRIYHPNMREVEADGLDVKGFIADCKALHAEALVFSVGRL